MSNDQIDFQTAKEFIEKYRQLCLFYEMKIGEDMDGAILEPIHMVKNDNQFLLWQIEALNSYLGDSILQSRADGIDNSP